MTDLTHKRRQALQHANELGKPMVLFEWLDDLGYVCEMTESAARRFKECIKVHEVIQPTKVLS